MVERDSTVKKEAKNREVSLGEELRRNRLFWVLYRKGFHNVFEKQSEFYTFNEEDYEDCMRAYYNPYQRILARVFFWNYAYSFLKKRKVQEILQDYFDYFNEKQEYFKIHSFQDETIMVMADTVAEDTLIVRSDLENISGESANICPSGMLGDVHTKSGFTNE